jgi:hypothetical protein
MAPGDGSWFTPRVGDDPERAATPVPATPPPAPDPHAELAPEPNDRLQGALVPRHPHDRDSALVPRITVESDPPPAPPWLGDGDSAGHSQRDQTRRAGGEPDAIALGLPEVAAWARRHGILLAGLAMIMAQLVWKAFFLSHFFFWQDDYHDLALALDHGLSWGYLMHMGSGHLIPGLQAVAWVLARAGLYDWALASAVTLAILAGASLAALRLLRTLFGDRPAILIPLGLYLLTPLTLPDLGWWSSAIESLPLQLSIFMSLAAHLRYVRTRRYRHAVAAAAWLAIGMLFFEKGVVLPLLLFAVTSGFLVEGRWPVAAGRCLRAYARAWLLYLLVLAGYVLLFAIQLHTSSAAPGRPGSYRSVLTFVSELVKDTLVPGAFGGPWQWLPSQAGPLGYAAPPSGLAWLSWIAAAAVIVTSIWTRRYAWRAWAILAGWVAAADMLPVIAGRLDYIDGSVLGLETRYLADAMPVLAICLGLAFLPVAGQREHRRAPRQRGVSAAGSQVISGVAAALAGAFVLGSIWSAQAYENATSSAPIRSFISNARASLATAPKGTIIVDQQVPATVALGTFGPYSYASKVVGEMARGEPARRLRWIRQPDGTYDNLQAFAPDGSLRPAVVLGISSPGLPAGNGCWPAKGRTVAVRLTSPVTAASTSILRIGYIARSAGVVTVSFGGHPQRLTVSPGLHEAYLPVQGAASAVIIEGLGMKRLCVGNLTIGVILATSAT